MQDRWARSWVEESRVVAVQNPNLPPQVVLINETLYWYWEHIQHRQKVNLATVSVETWRLMMSTARRIGTPNPWQRPTF